MSNDTHDVTGTRDVIKERNRRAVILLHRLLDRAEMPDALDTLEAWHVKGLSDELHEIFYTLTGSYEDEVRA
jgi:hypothetical protein